MNLIMKEGKGWWISFLYDYYFIWSPGPPTQFVGASEKWKCGIQKYGTPCSRNIRHFKTGKAEVGFLLSVEPFGQWRSQASGANSAWPEPTSLELAGFIFLKNDKVDKEEANMLHPRVLWMCLSSQVAGGRASSEDTVGGSQPGYSASNLLNATH